MLLWTWVYEYLLASSNSVFRYLEVLSVKHSRSSWITWASSWEASTCASLESQVVEPGVFSRGGQGLWVWTGEAVLFGELLSFQSIVVDFFSFHLKNVRGEKLKFMRFWNPSLFSFSRWDRLLLFLLRCNSLDLVMPLVLGSLPYAWWGRWQP